MTVLVYVEVYNSGGSKVFQQYWDNQSLTAGVTKTVEIGLFSPAWTRNLNWNGNAAKFSVTAPSSTPTPTPTPSPTPSPTPNGAVSGLHVSGNQILNSAGQSVRLHGVNRSGTEYACIQGWGIFDGPSDAASITAIDSWKANAVRVPLNEDCWLGINGAPAAYSGANYQQAISNYASTITGAGLAAILDLHWTAPGTTQATGQQPMPDADHSVTFRSQVAGHFKGNSSVVLEMFNESYPDNNQDTTAGWTCWRDGGTCSGVSYQVAGMQQLVNSVRTAGANNVILLGGLEYSNALSQWLADKPSDSAHNLAAAWHVYNFNLCSNTSCYSSTAGPVAASVPIVATEIGEDDCGSSFITTLMGWLDGQNQSYAAWT